MSVQTTYRFSTPIGQPGGIVDLAPYAIDTFVNENDDGVMKFGMGVITGTTAGTLVKVPVAGTTAAAFEGIVVNRRTNENALTGGTTMKNKCAVGVMRYGRIYAQLGASVEPAYGDTAYLIISGDDAGCFTNTSGASAVAVKGRFLSTASDGVAIVELFNQAQA